MSASIPTALGTQVRVADGRVGTVVYNSLIGVGIKWGLHDPNPADFAGTDGNTLSDGMPEDWPWEPEALVRASWRGANKYDLECVGDDVEILRHGLGQSAEEANDASE